ncbi:heat shock 70 kDa protein 12A-like [Mytilus trossulus]|uniref:heat shock 70 kDa protein 12A-like n=1 Tax=Mytilus trossulus TaxID=6551 RepID=UPI003004B992
MAEKKYLMVASLQLGRTYSCYAFSTRHEFKEDPLKIHVNPVWKTNQYMSMSTPTCLLLNKDKEFVAFGYEAENEYAEVILDGETDDYYFMKSFTTLLHNNKDVTDDMIIKDVTGKTLPASEVFRLSIKYLVSHLIQTLDKRGEGVGHEDLKWVLTIPSSWTETAKHIMKLSAEKAGIQSDHLVMVPESASAYIYYQTLRSQDNKQKQQDGAEYMVVNLGGFAADITVIKRQNDKLIESYHTTDNSCGSTFVNKQFFHIFDEISGESVMKNLKENDPLFYLDIEREFEAVKRSIDSEMQRKISLSIPIVALDKIQKFTECLRKIKHLKYLNGNIAVGLLGKVFRAQLDMLIAATEHEERMADEQKGINSKRCRESR